MSLLATRSLGGSCDRGVYERFWPSKHARAAASGESVVSNAARAQVTARDDSGQVLRARPRGSCPTGMLAADGPPTTLSPSGSRPPRLPAGQSHARRDPLPQRQPRGHAQHLRGACPRLIRGRGLPRTAAVHVRKARPEGFWSPLESGPIPRARVEMARSVCTAARRADMDLEMKST